MKKIIILGLTATLVLSVGIVSAFAVSPMRGAGYVDADGNGVCDNMGACSSFVDEDGDGICDNTGLYLGQGMGQGQSQGQGKGRNSKRS